MDYQIEDAEDKDDIFPATLVAFNITPGAVIISKWTDPP
jgi:hypothetical protein